MQQSKAPSATQQVGATVDVLFIDKYIDPEKSAEVLSQLQAKFHFNDQVRQQLASGYPVVIKQNTDPSTAQSLVRYITNIGGDCWQQDSDPDGYTDRRGNNRRQLADRRLLHRGWAILPDRRKGRERRIYFH